MDIVQLKPAQWPLWRDQLLAFAKRHGDRRLTAGGLRAMRLAGSGLIPGVAAASVHPASLFTAVLAYQSGKLLGFAFAADAGRSACLVVVHQSARGQGVGLSLIRELIGQFGSLCCHVAADNTASLRMFFRAGLKAVAIEEGPTGKPTLKLQTDGFNDAEHRPSEGASPSLKSDLGN